MNFSGVTLRKHSIPEGKPSLFLPPPLPLHALATDDGCSLRPGAPLRTGQARLRAAVTHYYSETVTSGVCSPVSHSDTRHVAVPLSSWCKRRGRSSKRTDWGSMWGGSAQHQEIRDVEYGNTTEEPARRGISSSVRCPEGRDGARAPPRGQRWHPACNHVSTPAGGPTRCIRAKMLTPRNRGDFLTRALHSVPPR